MVLLCKYVFDIIMGRTIFRCKLFRLVFETALLKSYIISILTRFIFVHCFMLCMTKLLFLCLQNPSFCSNTFTWTIFVQKGKEAWNLVSRETSRKYGEQGNYILYHMFLFYCHMMQYASLFFYSWCKINPWFPVTFHYSRTSFCHKTC